MSLLLIEGLKHLSFHCCCK